MGQNCLEEPIAQIIQKQSIEYLVIQVPNPSQWPDSYYIAVAALLDSKRSKTSIKELRYFSIDISLFGEGLSINEQFTPYPNVSEKNYKQISSPDLNLFLDQMQKILLGETTREKILYRITLQPNQHRLILYANRETDFLLLPVEIALQFVEFIKGGYEEEDLLLRRRFSKAAKLPETPWADQHTLQFVLYFLHYGREHNQDHGVFNELYDWELPKISQQESPETNEIFHDLYKIPNELRVFNNVAEMATAAIRTRICRAIIQLIED